MPKAKVSVIIPCYNAEKTILKTLKALENQNFDEPFEVIVCDDGSEDGTVDVAREFARKSKLRVRVFANSHHGPAWQRNFGAEKAQGEIVVFTDSDCVPGKNWLREMVKPIERGEAVGVQGTYRTLNRQSLMARFEGYEIEKRHEKMKRKKFIDFIGTFSAAYRRDVFLKFGGFDTGFETASGEDPELSYRIAKAGYKLVFNPKAFVYHPHPDTLKKYLRQKFYRAYWRVLMYSKHPEKMRGDSYTGMEVPVSVASLALFFFFCLLSPVRIEFLWLAILMLCIFFLANAGTIAFMTKKERKMLAFAPFVIFLRNIVWILGFSAGFLRLLVFKKLRQLLKPEGNSSCKNKHRHAQHDSDSS